MKSSNAMAQSHKNQTNTSLGSLSIVRPPLALTLGTGFFLTLSAIGWACFAKVPIKATAVGVLLPIDKITYSKALASGNVYYYMRNKSNKSITLGYEKDVSSFISNPGSFSEDQLVTLAKKLAIDPIYPSESRSVLSSDSYINKGSIFALIDNPSAREALLSAAISTLKSNGALRVKNKASFNQINLSMSQLSGQTSLLKSMVSLYNEGYISNPNVLSQEQTVDTLKSSVDTNRATIADTTGQIISKTEDLRSKISSYITNYLFVSKQGMYVFRQDHVQGQPVQTGDTILISSYQSKKLPTLIPVFMDSINADQVSVGNQITATPLGFDKSQYGGIRGRIVQLSMTSLSLDDVTNLTGLQSMAASVSQLTSSPVLALAMLETSKTPIRNQGIYKWSSRGIPPAPVRFNDGLTIDVTTNLVRPIELLVPAIRRFTGLSNTHKSQGRKAP